MIYCRHKHIELYIYIMYEKNILNTRIITHIVTCKGRKLNFKSPLASNIILLEIGHIHYDVS